MNHDAAHPEFTERSHRQGINIARFPQTLQDAIRIPKRLGFRYLWIDSVCIVQDSKKDWEEQSAAMTQIYGGARLNISASSSENSESGIFRPLQRQGVLIGTARLSEETHDRAREGGKEREDRVQKEEEGEHWQLEVAPPPGVLDLEDKHLATRGWVVQERLVSTATLHYTDEGMVWECARGYRVEQPEDRGFHNDDWKMQWKKVMVYGAMTASAVSTSVSSEAEGSARRFKDKADALRSWNSWTSAYSERNLYNIQDRLQAIAGVAKSLAARFALNYAAGLWQEDILGGLMWQRFNRTETLTRFEGDGTPTLSWASVLGRLTYLEVSLRESSKGPKLEIMGPAEVEEESPGSFGRVLSGRLEVSGMLQDVVVDKSVHPGVRQREWQEVGVRSGFVSPVNVLVMLDEPRKSQLLYHCWCLRLGSYDASVREGDAFLLLEQVDEHGNEFRRVGFAVTDPWTNRIGITADSGRLDAPELRRLVLV